MNIFGIGHFGCILGEIWNYMKRWKNFMHETQGYLVKFFETYVQKMMVCEWSDMATPPFDYKANL